MAKLWVTDSGAVERRVKKLYVVDSGGITRKLKKLYVVDSGGTARLVYTGSVLETTITVGYDGSTTYGYNSAFYGSIGNDTFTDPGGTSRLIKDVLWDGSFVQLILSGGAVPNTNDTFESITLNSTALVRSSATYTAGVSGGTATKWVWNNGFLVSSGSVSLVIQ